MLVRVEIKGFKCLRDVSVDLRPFSVLIGPNDSGKSSFLQALTEARRGANGMGNTRMATMTGRQRSVRLCAKDGEISFGFAESESPYLKVGGQDALPATLGPRT